MSEDRFQLLERGGLVPSGALERAVQAGLKSNPRRFADALFRVPRNANLFSVLRGQVECGAISVEPGLFGDLVEASSEWGATPKALVALESGNAVVPEGFVDWLMKQGDTAKLHGLGKVCEFTQSQVPPLLPCPARR